MQCITSLSALARSSWLLAITRRLQWVRLWKCAPKTCCFRWAFVVCSQVCTQMFDWRSTETKSVADQKHVARVFSVGDKILSSTNYQIWSMLKLTASFSPKGLVLWSRAHDRIRCVQVQDESRLASPSCVSCVIAWAVRERRPGATPNASNRIGRRSRIQGGNDSWQSILGN